MSLDPPLIDAYRVVATLNAHAYLGCSSWAYYRYGDLFYCGSKQLSGADGRAAAKQYLDQPPQDQGQP